MSTDRVCMQADGKAQSTEFDGWSTVVRAAAMCEGRGRQSAHMWRQEQISEGMEG